jgi:hypothetical protein
VARVSAAADLLHAYVERHNDCVRSGDFGPMLARFADEAELVFEGVPVGPFRGIEAIAAAYRERPPDDVIRAFDERVDGDEVTASYAWSRQPDVRAGELRLTLRDGRITRLLVTFD